MKNLIRISLAVVALLGAQVAAAQTKTISLSVSNSGGDRDAVAADLQVREGDTITITLSESNFEAGNAAHTRCLSFTGTAAPGTAVGDGVDFYGLMDNSAVNTSPCARDKYQAAVTEGTTRTQTYRIHDDATSESAETIMLMLTGAYRFSTGLAAHSAISVDSAADRIAVTILASDAATYSIARAGAATVNEGQSVDFTVTMSGASAANVDVPYTVTGSGAYNVASGDRSGNVRVTAGMTSATLTLELPFDAGLGTSDPAQTLTVTVGETPTISTGGGEITRGTPISAQVTVNFIDTTLTITGPTTLQESDTGYNTGNYTITRSGAEFAAETTVTITIGADNDDATDNALADGSGAADVGFAGGGTVTFAAGEDSKTFLLAVTGDDIAEMSEVFTLTTSGTGVTPAAPLLVVTILDDDTDDDTSQIVGYVESSQFFTREGLTNTINFRVELNGETATDNVEFAYTIVPGPGFTLADLSAPAALSGTETLDADHATMPVLDGAVRVTAADDSLNEADETFTVTATATMGSVNIPVRVLVGTFTFTDNDPITATLSAASLDEGGAANTVTISLDNEPTRQVTVNYTIGSDSDDTTADANRDDWRVTAGRAVFAAGETAAVTILTLVNDDLTEAAETFTVAITPAQISGAFGDATGDSETYTIAASDPIAAVITAESTDVTEGGNAVLNVDLGAVSGEEVTVEYTFANTAATDDVGADLAGTTGADFTDAGGGSITIAPMRRTETITFAIVDDTVNEPAETFAVTVTITAPASAGGSAPTVTSGGTTTFTIAESDPFTVAISPDRRTVTERDSVAPAVTAEFTVTLTGATSSAGGDITVPFTVGSDSTAAAADYSLAPASSLVLDADHATEPVLSGTITVTVTADDDNEDAETVIIELGDATATDTVTAGAITAGRSTATLTITDDDRINLGIGLAAGSGVRVTEGSDVTFQVQLTGGAPTTAISVRYAISGVSAADYHDPNGGVITLPASTAAGANVDFMPITINVDAVPEADEELTLAITAAGAHDSATAPATFTAAQRARVNFGGSSARGVVTINEGPAAARTLAVTVAAATDCATPAAADAEFAEGDSVTFCVTPSEAFTGNATLNYAVIDGTTGTAVADDFDSGERSGTVSITATDASVDFTIDINDESVNEPAQTFTVRVTAAMPAAQGGTVAGISPVVTIAANDPVQFRIPTTDTSVTEGNDANLSVALANGDRLTAPLTIPVIFSGTATRGAGNDYTSVGEVVIRGALTHTAPLVVTTLDDNLNEAGETVIVTLDHANARMPGGGEFSFRGMSGDDTVTVTIDDNDAIAITVADDADGVQEGGAAEFTVNLDKASAGVVTVNFTASIGGSMGGTPSPASDSIDIPAGQTMGIIRINIPNNDDLDSGTRTLTVTLANAQIAAPGSGATVTTTDTATATVTYREIPRAFSVAVADSTTDRDTTTAGTQVNEGDTAVFTISLAGTDESDTPSTATVNWSAEGADVSRSGSVTLSTGNSQTVTIAIPVDNDIEAAEMLTITLTAPAAGFDNDTGISGGSASVTVSDDGARAPTITLRGPSTIAIRGNQSPKSGTGTYHVSVTQTPAASVSVTVSVTGDPMNCGSGSQACIVASASSLNIAVPAADEAVEPAMFTVQATDPDNTPTAPYDITVTVSVDSSEMAGGTVAFSPISRSLTVSVVDREPEEDEARRVQRLKAPLESLARSVGQLAAGAIGDRLRTASAPGGGPLTIGGKTVTTATAAQLESASGAWAGNPHERNGVNFGLSGGDSAGSDMKEILAQTSFALGHGDGGGGLWASGGRISSDGDTGGVRYNSDTTSWHIGFDRVWNDGLLGVSLAHTDSEIDIDDTMTQVLGSKLESDLLSVHPYMTGQLDGGGWVWATIGYGSGDAELTETHNDNGTVKTDVEVVTVGIGAEISPIEGIKLHIKGTAANAKLDAAEFSSGRATLRSVNGTALRANAGLEGGVDLTLDGGTVLHPFITLSARVDSGDGHDGTSLDWGGGLDARTSDGLFARVEGRWQVDGKGPDEEILSLTIRQEDMWEGALAPYARMNLNGAATGLRLQRGRFGLDMEVGMDNEDGVGLQRLLQGRWLF